MSSKDTDQPDPRFRSKEETALLFLTGLQPIEFKEWLENFDIICRSNNQDVKDEYSLYLSEHRDVYDVMEQFIDMDDAVESEKLWNRVILKRPEY